MQLLARARPLAVAAGVLVGARADSRPAEAVVPRRRGAARRAPPTRIATRPTDAARPTRRRGAAAGCRRTRRRRRSAQRRSRLRAGGARRREAGRHAARRACASIRRQIATETGIVVPPVHVADNLQLGPRDLRDSRQGRRSRARRAVSRIGCSRSIRARRRRRSRASPTREPAFGLPASWIPPDQRDARLGRRLHRRRSDDGALDAPVGDDPHVPARSAEPPADQGDGRSRRRRPSPKLVEELVPKVRVGRRHAARAAAAAARARAGARPRRRFSRRSPTPPPRTKDPDAITEAVRAALGRAICRPYQNERGELPAISFAPALEERLLSSIVRTDQGAVLALDPTQAQRSGVADRRRARPAQWHSLCFCARQRSVRISGDCSRGCCRTSACSRTTRFRRSCSIASVAVLD